jgi:hypothetical protein
MFLQNFEHDTPKPIKKIASKWKGNNLDLQRHTLWVALRWLFALLILVEFMDFLFIIMGKNRMSIKLTRKSKSDFSVNYWKCMEEREWNNWAPNINDRFIKCFICNAWYVHLPHESPQIIWFDISLKHSCGSHGYK